MLHDYHNMYMKNLRIISFTIKKGTKAVTPDAC